MPAGIATGWSLPQLGNIATGWSLPQLGKIATRWSLPQGFAALLLALLPLPALAANVAIVGGTVHTLTGGGPLENATVLVENGRIRAVGNDLEVPAGFERIDARGKVVTPGLVESFTQLGLVEISGETTTVDAVVGPFVIGEAAGVERYRLGPAFDVQYGINGDSVLLPVNRMEGVTRAVVAPVPGNDPFSGWGAAIRLTPDDALTQPRLAMFGSIGAGTARFAGGSRSAMIQRLRMGLEEAASFRPNRDRERSDFDYTRHEMTALHAFMESGSPLVLSVHRANEIEEAVALKRDFGVPVVIHGGAEAWKVARTLAAAEVPVIVDVLDNIPISYDQLGARIDNAALLHQAGVQVLFTAEDSHNARLVRQVAGNAVAEGMPWEAALAAMTRAPAEVYGMTDGLGTLSEGAPADVVIWNGDPLELTTWAERVMIDGEWTPMESRQTRLLERYRDLESEEPYGYR